MNRDVKKFLQDIFDSIVLIESYFQIVPTLSAYKSNAMMIDAVERRLSIIGEAMWKADKLNKEIAISNKNKIISLRHILVHDYDLIDPDAIWMIYKKNLPILRTEVETILNSK